MKTLISIILILSSPYMVSAQTPVATDFGRFYTTPRERTQLEESRVQAPRDEIETEFLVEEIPDANQPSQIVNLIDSIKVNGLVYRTDGKNTAWINSNSTVQGSIENQYTRVQERDVNSNSVEIRLPDNRTSIELKPGQQYDVNSNQVYDIINEPLNPNSIVTPRNETQQR
jgi:hypothetical protein